MRHPACENLLHWLKIIRLAFCSTDFEFSVLWLFRKSVYEYNHRCYGICSLYMWNIIAFHSVREVSEVKFFCKVCADFIKIFVDFNHFFNFGVIKNNTRIFVCKHLKLFALCWFPVAYFNLFTGDYIKPFLIKRFLSYIFKLVRNNLIRKFQRECVVVFLKECCKEFCLIFFFNFIYEVFFVNKPSLAYHEYYNCKNTVLWQKRNNILIEFCIFIYNLLLFKSFFQVQIAVAQTCSFLKLFWGSIFFHLFFQLRH